MSRRSIRVLLGLCLLAGRAGAQAGHSEHAATEAGAPRLGTINFPTSAPADAQAEFQLGVLYLHSFEYLSAERAFRRAEGLAPNFALAYWGEAMTYTHPVWNEQDLSSARGALERLGPTPEARRAKAPSAREQAWLGAIEALYGEGTKPQRDTLYASAMEKLVRQFPQDQEAKAFYALSLLGLNQGVRDTVTYLRAAPYADTVFRANPDHPGAAHYLIHAYDDPLHAQQGLAAARAYARIAPDAAHAQHMTTHIFLAMGMWDDVVAQNRIAVGLTAPVPGHYTSWLAYGLIQQGKYDAAHSFIEELQRSLNSEGQRAQHSALAEARAHWLLHAEDWNSPISRWHLDRSRMTGSGRLVDIFADGVIAYRRRDATALGAVGDSLTAQLQTLQRDGELTGSLGFAGRIMARELGAMQLFLGGAREAAVRSLREAGALEDAMPMDFGPPVLVEPTHELLGNMLLEMDPSEAVRQFQRALVLAPGRSRALLGLARGAVATGDKATARRAIDQLLGNWHAADPRVRDAIAPLRRLVDRMP